jgi:hypothetical protein
MLQKLGGPTQPAFCDGSAAQPDSNSPAATVASAARSMNAARDRRRVSGLSFIAGGLPHQCAYRVEFRYWSWPSCSACTSS